MNKQPQSSIVLNISHSTISGLNLGSVVGDMNATLTTLEQQGSADLAQALKRLSEVIASDERLGRQRREFLENVSLIAEQGRLPGDERRTGVVRAAYQYLANAAAISANVATIWGTVGPAIAAFFSLNN